MEIGPEGDGGWDVVIDDSCDWVQDRKITLPKVAATLNLHGGVPYAILIAAFSASIAQGEHRCCLTEEEARRRRRVSQERHQGT